MPATYDDAALMVQLLRWSTELGLDESVHAVMSDNFHPETASVEDDHVRKVLTFGEAVATFVKQDVLDKGLVLDMWWVQGLWARVGGAAHKVRIQLHEPRLYENFEALAGSEV